MAVRVEVFALKNEAASSSEIITWRHNTDDPTSAQIFTIVKISNLQ
jgi:hypothetical protein